MRLVFFMICAVFFTASAVEEEFNSYREAAAAAEKKNDMVSALENYDLALSATRNSALKLEVLQAEYRILLKQQKGRVLEEKLTRALEDASLKECHQRAVLNMLAGFLIWSDRYEYALNLLNRAGMLEAPRASNEYYQTYEGKARIWFSRKNRPEVALEILQEVLNIPETHPANRYSANLLAGSACEKLGRPAEALSYYRTAVAMGKKVTYKFSTAAAEKAVERLTGKNGKGKLE
ncbi:MAG: hypothetical protein BWY31_04412 [Lentisphaerae bacterium ADurb.Bin242]|nr:MAG: hypothetical protein BWY31_04412 [Lentisphaerae bacterium ADurb.Bin242]